VRKKKHFLMWRNVYLMSYRMISVPRTEEVIWTIGN